METDLDLVPRSARARPLRVAGFLGAGALCALALGAIRAAGAGSAPASTAVALWATDRDAGALYTLDADLMVTRTIACGWPLQASACRDGGAWVLRSGNGTPNFGGRLDRRSAEGELITEVTLGTCTDLDVNERDEALVIESKASSHPDRALRIRLEGSLFPLLEMNGLTCVAPSHASVALGTASGEVLRVDPLGSGAILAQTHLGGRIGDIARGPDEESLWVLDVSGSRRLYLLDADLSVRWSVPVGLRALHFAPVPNEERVWLADTVEPRVRRFGPSGWLELDVVGLPLAGMDRTAAWLHGGVLCAAPGAIIHLDAGGHLQPGQGGFDYLTDLAPAR
jgi:hypothetical protein